MNPVKEIRSHLNLTQARLADLSGISTQGVLRYEQSLYEDLSKKLLDTLVDLAWDAGYPSSDLTHDQVRNLIIQQYEENRLTIQLSAARYFKDCPLITSHGRDHPFVTWRTKCLGTESRMKFCILLAVHPASVAEYEKGKRRYMPRLLRDALHTAAVGNDILERLDYAGAIYYDDLKHSGGL